MKKEGFTLIELLIVVAIIAILAAIAVPNFLEAQTRAKVSRAKADLRTLAVALEAYRVDGNNYPYVSDDDAGEWIMPAGAPKGRPNPGGLTSPIAYLTSALYDPFVMENRDSGGGTKPRGPQYLHYERSGFGYDENGIPYNHNGTGRREVHVPLDANGTIWGTTAGAPNGDETSDLSKIPTEYVLYSIGPDRTHRVYAADKVTIISKSRWSVVSYYDPTNGTISSGNVVRFSSGHVFP
ncbi:prepilin-type N-terminal cleavage/methylation domain-containing protein [Candidatus Sumerlaeota bacterium]|nr:prepilin-type N-terminal cleavage/methylation domain-containing protein [Candidatus Sumerlaeota bacterium]